MVSKKTIQFTNELESNAKVPFLDVLLMRNNREWMKKKINKYRKESNSDVCLHWDSFTPISLKRGTLKTLVERANVIRSIPKLLEK